MKSKNKKLLYASLLIGCILLGYLLWLSLRPVEIIAIHLRHNYSDILVNNFPLTERGKIHWWLTNKKKIRDMYNIPKPAEDGFFTVIFWGFGDGYKETDGYDRLCFDDMKAVKNCIDKNSLMMVVYSKNTGLYFRMDSGKYYVKENGEIVKRKYE
ncbi:DUF943 family protein [Erwinia sp. 198]|uniref:DUF943 family protein n=1 Tax=Erwinia sp. 198 TaxID=2022746 RepID=UPI000F67B522|nr:DUF943 family protein [Erwinia sp. 198]RRZ90863.1 DUF943 family protein [Erwinia sp. 198]